MDSRRTVLSGSSRIDNMYIDGRIHLKFAACSTGGSLYHIGSIARYCVVLEVLRGSITSDSYCNKQQWLPSAPHNLYHTWPAVFVWMGMRSFSRFIHVSPALLHTQCGMIGYCYMPVVSMPTLWRIEVDVRRQYVFTSL